MNRNQLLTLLFLFAASLCYGQGGLTLKTEGDSLEEFVPKNWKIIRTAKGDLNKDNVEDAALVIQEMDPKKIVINTGYGEDTLDTNARILMVMLKDTTVDKFKLKGVSTTFILSHVSPTMSDPFEGLAISKGILEIGFHFWANAGSWFVTSVQYKFWFQKNEIALIGAEFDEMHRGTMETTQRSFNFLSKKMSEKKFNSAEGDQKATTEWKNLDFKDLKTLKTLIAPLQWAILPGISI